jgi:hypothetical protein
MRYVRANAGAIEKVVWWLPLGGSLPQRPRMGQALRVVPGGRSPDR